jgi:hypothetical protein
MDLSSRLFGESGIVDVTSDKILESEEEADFLKSVTGEELLV